MRPHVSFGKAISVAGGFVVGALLVVLVAPGPAADAIPMQDPGISLQIQQEVMALRLAIQNRLDMMQLEIDNVERNLDNLSYRFQSAENSRLGQPAPTPIDPIPGQPTFGRLVSEESQSQRFVLRDASGHPRAALAQTPEGPALLLFDLEGSVTASLVSTADGAELRMRDADGNLQAVVASPR